jgi:L-lactate dehydrogenase complex protein LldE
MPAEPSKAAGSKAPQQVYFFATCVIDLFEPRAGLDAITLLERAGIEVNFPERQSCCGQAAYTSGFRAEARRVAAAQLGLFPEPWPIVVPSGSCAGMMRDHWPGLFADDPRLQARAIEVGSRVVELTAFLVESVGVAALGLPASGAPTRVVLHTSCAARREMGTHVPSRELLRSLPGVEVVTQAREAECCGFGGTFSMRHPAVSGAMVQDKLQSVTDTGCDALVSADCGCLQNINHHAEYQQARLRGKHIASFVLKRLDPAAGGQP